MCFYYCLFLLIMNHSWSHSLQVRLPHIHQLPFPPCPASQMFTTNQSITFRLELCGIATNVARYHHGSSSRYTILLGAQQGTPLTVACAQSSTSWSICRSDSDITNVACLNQCCSLNCNTCNQSIHRPINVGL